MSLPPTLDVSSGLAALKAMAGPRNLPAALAVMRKKLGYVFRLPLKGFSPVVISGPAASHFALIEGRDRLNWRKETDPVTELLGHGLLVEDGASHDSLRRQIMPALHRKQVEGYIGKMWNRTNQILDLWQPGQTLDMLVEMRRLALLIIMDTLFDVDITSDLERLLPSILKVLKFISPGIWLLGFPPRKVAKPIAEIDAYLYGLIRQRKASPTKGEDLLSQMIAAGMEDRLIRDQMLTLLIAGHDTSTALLAWALYLAGSYPQASSQMRLEVELLPAEQPPLSEQIASMAYFEQVINETLRLYPPIHAGNRVAQEDLSIYGFEVLQSERIMISYYATHHDESHWEDPERFDPHRFDAGAKHAPYSFLPFGGGPRNCLGANFAQVEAVVVLARLFQRFEFELKRRRVHLHMGATLEPRPGVFMKVEPR